MTIAPERTEILRRSEFRLAEGGDGQTLEGYAAVFNAWTDIRDSQGTYKERIAPGAFKRSLGQRTPVLQFDHGTHPMFGSLPLGAITVLREDRAGLFVRARLSDNWLIQPVRDAIRDGAVNGMSFRFRVVDDEWGEDAEGGATRELRELELLELGPVVFPAYDQTSVAVRSLVGALDDATRAELTRELDATSHPAGSTETNSTSPVAGEPAQEDDGPDEPPVASHDNRTQIAETLQRFRQHTLKGQP
jgi:HK97 family phage prohead protease